MTSADAVHIRAAERSDLAEIERLLRDAELPVTGVAEILHANPHTFLVASGTANDRLVGVGGLEICCDDALLRSVAVAQDWRGSGVGRDLINGLVSLAEARGMRALYLLTLTAERYFPRFGFTRVDRATVPVPIAATTEFSSVCPSTATVMMRPLQPDSRGV